MTLCGDAFAPITSRIGFLQAPINQVSEALKVWRGQIHGSSQATELSGGLVRNVHVLEPLTIGIRPRELLVATRNPGWTALFDCGINGGDPVASVGYLARTMQVHGAVVCSVPHEPGAGPRGRYGALQLEIFGPVQTDFLNYVRTISLAHDGRKWRFDVSGAVQPFEDVDVYARRKTTDKFTLDMLDRYAHELGLDPFNPGFYEGPSVLLTNPSGRLHPHEAMTLPQAQQRLGITSLKFDCPQ